MSADQPPQKKESELLKNAMSIIAAKEAEAAEACNETWNEPMLNFTDEQFQQMKIDEEKEQKQQIKEIQARMKQRKPVKFSVRGMEADVEQEDRKRTRVLFVSTKGDCRAIMAVAWARSLHADTIAAYAAGVTVAGAEVHAGVEAALEAHGMEVPAVKVRHVDAYAKEEFDFVLSLSAEAQAASEGVKGKAFSTFTKADASDCEALAAELKGSIESLPDFLMFACS